MRSPPNGGEGARLAALRSYGILDTPPEAGFDHITSVVTRLFQVPIAAVTLIDAERQWFKSIRGLDVRETPRHVSFCAHAMESNDVLVVPDATLDPRFARNPFVNLDPGLRFYAGAPLHTPEGYPLGALCLIDYHPRQFSQEERQMLLEMAILVEDELLLRRVAKELRVEIIQRQQSEQALRQERQIGEELRARLHKQPPPAGGGHPGESHRDRLDVSVPEKENRFRHLVEQATDALFVYDLEGRFIDVNAAASKLVGYSREELLCMRVHDLEISFDAVKGPRRWRAMSMGEAVTMEGLNRRKDGSIFPAEVRVSIVELGSGRCLLALVRDTTEQKKAEALLQVRARQQREVARLGMRALRGGSLDTLLDEALVVIGDTLHLNICRVLEHAPERGEMIIRAGFDLPAEERGAAGASDSEKYAAGHVVRTGEPVIVEDALNDPRFEPTPWLRAAGAVSGLHVPIAADGSHSRQFGVLAAYARERRVFTGDDVSFVQSVANVLGAAIARQRVEDALRIVESRYRRISAYTPGVVYQYLTRPDGTVSIPFISESCRALFQCGPEEVRAAPEIIVNSIHRDDRPGFQEAIRQAEATLTPLQWRGRHVLPDGGVRWVRFDSRPERLPDGGVICDGIIVDVTAEEEAREALRSSKEEAQRANAAKSVFLSRMSHELRTPLNAILGFGQLLELGDLDAQESESVGHILKGGRHLLSLVDEVLDLARVETGELRLKLVAVPLDKLARDCVGFISRTARLQGVALIVEPGAAAVLADERRLRQVLLNLLSNAIKYNREGGKVTLTCAQTPAGRVRLSIRDTGFGISAEGLERLFVPFERLGQEVSGVEGSGLGLVVSRHLMEALGGTLGVESEVGVGSVFWIELPPAGENQPAAAEATGTGARAAATPPGLLSEARPAATLLYIEDNVSNVQVMAMVIARFRPQWRFLVAGDGRSGLQSAHTHLPDAIVLDLQLPVLKGDAVLAELRAAPETRHIPVLLLSADAMAHSRERLLALGANDYLAKPFDIGVLLGKVDAMLRRQEQGG